MRFGRAFLACGATALAIAAGCASLAGLAEPGDGGVAGDGAADGAPPGEASTGDGGAGDDGNREDACAFTCGVACAKMDDPEFGCSAVHACKRCANAPSSTPACDAGDC